LVINNLYKIINDTELNIDFEFLSEYLKIESLDLRCPRYWENQNIHKNWVRVFGEECKNNKVIFFGAGAQFIVSKTKILKNSKEFYANIIKMLEYANDPMEGYDLERFHKYIFN